MIALVGLLRATHPLPAFAVTVLATLVAFSRNPDPSVLSWVFASTAAGQVSVGWSNDFIDRERDRAAGRSDKPIVAGDVEARTVLAAAFVALPLSAILSLPLGLPEAVVMLAAVSSAWAYNAGLKATVLSVLPYAVSFGLAPVYVWLATSDSLPPAWVIAAGALLGSAAHLLNALPDFETDRAGSAPGLVHRLGFRRSLFLACAVLASLLATVLLADGVPAPGRQLAAAAVAVVLIVAVSVAGLRGAARLGFRLTVLAAGAIVAAFVLSPATPRI